VTAQLETGSVFAGDFRIERPLSSGGMGSVFVVSQLSTGSKRALKLMRPELVSDPALRERFLQEARIGARIPSDHVVSVIASGIDAASGMPWLAMELLVGEDLEARVRRLGPRPLEETVLAMRQVGHALERAHAAGVIHRDLKPGNLFFAESRSADVPFQMKILDFGIAKLLDEAQSNSTMSVGTPLWMAPEQTERSGRVGPQSDLWSLGLIVFYLLTGRIYWATANVGTSSIPTLLREVLFEAVVAPSRRAAELGCGHLWPPALDGWFLQLLERDPERRERDVRRVVSGLEAALGAAGPTAPALLNTQHVVGQTGPAMGAPGPLIQASSSVGWAAAPGPLITSPVAIPPRPPSRRGWLLGTGVALLLAVAAGFFLFGRRRRTVRAVESEESEDATPRPRRKRVSDCRVIADLVESIGALETLPPGAIADEVRRLHDGLDVDADEAPWKDEAKAALAELEAAVRAAVDGQPFVKPKRWQEFVGSQTDRCPEILDRLSPHAPEPNQLEPRDGDPNPGEHGSP
jgi:eukaryotic-like serine/threonine-protein kinase